MELHEKQRDIVRSGKRYKVIRAGRRSGKTTLETEVMLFKAVTKADRSIFYIAPTQKQARSIIWEALKSRIGNIGDANESRLEMKVPTQDGGFSIIYVAGWENRENFRGMKAHHITFDELDTMKDFFIGYQEIFRPALTDTSGTADFIGTPKKENPNLRRLEKEAEQHPNEWDTFRFTTADNPHIPREEIVAAQNELDPVTYKQEFEAEYVENDGALFRYSALIDMFSNSIEKKGGKFMLVDIADDGSDKTIFTFWDGLDMYDIEQHSGLNTENIINNIREYAAGENIPYSHIAVDAIGVGAGVASSSLLDGVIGFKSSFGAIKTDHDATRLPGVHYTKEAPLISEYQNLRSQCIFLLAQKVNGHDISVSVEDGRVKEAIIEELSHYQDVSKGDGKRMASPKDDIKVLIGRSPDITDTMIMRMYFEIRERMLPAGDVDVVQAMEQMFMKNRNNRKLNSTK